MSKRFVSAIFLLMVTPIVANAKFYISGEAFGFGSETFHLVGMHSFSDYGGMGVYILDETRGVWSYIGIYLDIPLKCYDNPFFKKREGLEEPQYTNMNIFTSYLYLGYGFYPDEFFHIGSVFSLSFFCGLKLRIGYMRYKNYQESGFLFPLRDIFASPETGSKGYLLLEFSLLDVTFVFGR